MNAPLRLQGVDVGATLIALQTAMHQLDVQLTDVTARLATAEVTIEELKARNALLQSRLGDVEILTPLSSPAVTAILTLAHNATVMGEQVTQLKIGAVSTLSLVNGVATNVSALQSALAWGNEQNGENSYKEGRGKRSEKSSQHITSGHTPCEFSWFDCIERIEYLSWKCIF